MICLLGNNFTIVFTYPKIKVVSYSCQICKSKDIAKKGFRYNKTGKKQKYQCAKCKAWFILDDGFNKMRFKKEIIVKAVHQHIDGLSLDKVKNHLWQHEGVKVTKWTISEWTSKYGKLIKKLYLTLKTRIIGRIHINDKQIKVGKGKGYDMNAIDSKTKFILAHSVVAIRSTYNVILFVKQIKDWCYEQILQTYYRERHKKKEQRKLITFVYDGFENYHNACKKLFCFVAKLVFGVPIACKKYGLNHNNNAIERYNREIDRRNYPKQNFLSHEGAVSFSLMRTIIHNFVNPHNQLTGLTPAEAAGINLKLGRNKLLNLIRITARLR